MVKGIQNKYLQIDLDTKTSRSGTPPDDLFAEYLGGKGMGLKIMMDLEAISGDPFDAANPLVFVTGPFTGTPVQTSARSALVTLSPLTGTFLDSHVGGHFGPMIKRAGYDYIIVTGKSEQPVYLVVTPEGVVFEDASTLWGRGIFDTEKSLKAKYPKSRIASIGQAGENRVRFACIGTDYYRQFGRGGAGAVMGSKNLKAVVVEGNEKVDFFNRDQFVALNSRLTDDLKKHPNRAKRFELGTNMWIRMGQEDGHFLPTRNFQDVHFEDYEQLTSESMKKVLNWKSVGCFNCIIQCSKMAKWKGYELEGPEYETTAYLGSGCGIGDAESVALANYICDDLGLDTISAGVVTSFAMEAFEKGILSPQACDGLELNFGNARSQASLLKKIAERDGIGDLLAEGTRIASKRIGKGSEYFAIQTAGMELSGVNIKGCASMGLTLATSDFASHTRFWSASDEMAGNLTFENTPEYVKKGQDEVNARNSLIVCDFLPFGFDRLAPLYESLTGIRMDETRLMEIGDKISNLTRMINIRNGRTRQDDSLPQRFFKEKHLAGIFKGEFMSRDIFSKWLDMYYRASGWDSDGIPTDATLSRLGLNRL
jgi:aldehyde:ferredoxin oxidoreductase